MESGYHMYGMGLMNLALVVCPGCRTLTGDRLDVRTLDRDRQSLVCECGRRYPIVDGVPIVMAPSCPAICATRSRPWSSAI